jgi:peptidoglycan/LPS O-acetylase OafA/YrhL
LSSSHESQLSKGAEIRNFDRVLARLSRRTSTGRYIAEVDGFRFVCIALILLFHLDVVARLAGGSGSIIEPFGFVHFAPARHGWLSTVFAQGHVGVHLFFMISGFILALPFVSQHFEGSRKVDVRRYYLRRLTRLEPPYILALALSLLLAMATRRGSGSLVPHAIAGLGYAHSLLYGWANPVNGAFWSLEVEVQFYLLVPLLALLFKIRETARRRQALIVANVLLLQTQVMFAAKSGALQLSLLNSLQFFLVGFLLADIYVVDWKQTPTLDRRWDFVSIIGWPVFLVGASVGFVAEYVFLPWLGFLLLCAAFRGPMTRRVLRNRWLTTIGGMCYSIYLLHYPVMLVLGGHFRSLLVGSAVSRLIAQFLLVLPVVFIAGLGFYVLIERPCMQSDWPSRLIAGTKAFATRRGKQAPMDVDHPHLNVDLAAWSPAQAGRKEDAEQFEGVVEAVLKQPRRA